MLFTLIGMPGSGKSSIGRALANKCGREFFDADEAFSAGGKYNDADNEYRNEKQGKKHVFYDEFGTPGTGSPFISYGKTCNKVICCEDSVHNAGCKHTVTEASAFKISYVFAQKGCFFGIRFFPVSGCR